MKERTKEGTGRKGGKTVTKGRSESKWKEVKKRKDDTWREEREGREDFI